MSDEVEDLLDGIERIIKTFDFESDLQSDPNALDNELLHHPIIMEKYGKMLAILETKRDQAKNEIDLVKSELDNRARTSPRVEKELGKITEVGITQWIIRQPAYREALSDYNKAVFLYNVFNSAYKALVSKGKALEGLISLYIGQYFVGPKIPNELKITNRNYAIDKVRKQLQSVYSKEIRESVNQLRKQITHEEEPMMRRRK